MESEKLNIIFYVFIAIFSITAIITFLGITNVLKTIKERYLNAMFGALVIEVVAAVVLTYKQIDFSCQTETIIDRLASQVNSIPPEATMEEQIIRIEEEIKAKKEVEKNLKAMQTQLESLESTLANCTASQGTTNNELSTLDKVFYSNVIKLRIISEKFRGRTINLLWDKANKGEVYKILGQIFLELGYVGPDDQLTDDYIIKKYIKFAKDSGWDYLLKTDEAGNYTQVLVDEYATTIFLRKYLNQKYPLKKPAE